MYYDLFFIHHLGSYVLTTMHQGPHANWPSQFGFAFYLKMWAWHAAHHQHFGGQAWALHRLSHHSQARIRIRLRGKWHHHGHLFETWVALVHRHDFIAKRVVRVR